MNDLLVNAVIGFLSAGLAGYLGVQFGLARHKRESAFARQLQWHDQALEAFAALKVSYREAEAHLKADPPRVEGYEAAMTSLKAQIKDVALLMVRAKAYATPRTAQVLDTLETDLRVGGQMLAVAGRIATEMPGEDWKAGAIKVLRYTGSLSGLGANALAADLRMFLGLPALSDQNTWDEMQADSRWQELRRTLRERADKAGEVLDARAAAGG